MNRKLANRENYRGFTLVEMLVVVLIIGILAGLISAAALRARNRARVAAVAAEISQLSMALNNYKTQFGEYPPDFAGLDGSDSPTDLAAKDMVIRHLARAFPRFVLSGTTTQQKWTNLGTYIFGLDALGLNPAKALPAWLGGMRDAQGRAIGFSKDPANPFDTTTPSRIGPFFDFDPGRVQNAMYYPPGVLSGTGQPYIYFRAESVQGHPVEYCVINGSNPPPLKTWSDVAGATIIDSAKPYWDDRNKCWVNDTSYQILCCGLDGKFGKENVYKNGRVAGAVVPDGTNPPGYPDLTAYVIGLDSAGYTSLVPLNFDHIDDQTNFTTGTIGDELP